MKPITFATAGYSPALMHARNLLSSWGYPVALEINESITHIVLPVPSMDQNQKIHGGINWEDFLLSTPEKTIIMGGKIPQMEGRTIDFLNDEFYIAENAAITAHCTLAFILQNIKRTLNYADVLIIGWGRIGKCLWELMRSIGARVTVAVRNDKDKAILMALGCHAIQINQIQSIPYSIIINTVPAPIWDISSQSNNTLIVDLASERGISGEGVHWERGLPGRIAPETSGILIAKTALRYALGKE